MLSPNVSGTGCGKTSLLALCAGNAEYLSPTTRAEGVVLLDGVPMDAAARRQVCVGTGLSLQAAA